MGASLIHNVPKEFDIALDLKRPISNTDFEVVEGDTENYIVITLTDDAEPVNVDDNRIVAVFTHSKGSSTQDSASEGGGITIDGNEITIHLKTGSFSVGMVECELRIYGELSAHSTTPVFNFNCRASLLSSAAVASQNNFDMLTGLIAQVGNALSTLTTISDEYANLPYIDVVYTDTNPASSSSVTYSKTPGEYMGVFCSTNGRPQSASDYTWVHLAQPPYMTSASIGQSGNIEITLSDSSTVTVTGSAAAIANSANSALAASAPVTAFNVSVAPSSFVASNRYRGYGYCAAVPCTGMRDTFMGSVVFSPDDTESGNFAPVAVAGTDCVYIYSRTVPQDSISVISIKGDRV